MQNHVSNASLIFTQFNLILRHFITEKTICEMNSSLDVKVSLLRLLDG